MQRNSFRNLKIYDFRFFICTLTARHNSCWSFNSLKAIKKVPTTTLWIYVWVSSDQQKMRKLRFWKLLYDIVEIIWRTKHNRIRNEEIERVEKFSRENSSVLCFVCIKFKSSLLWDTPPGSNNKPFLMWFCIKIKINDSFDRLDMKRFRSML